MCLRRCTGVLSKVGWIFEDGGEMMCSESIDSEDQSRVDRAGNMREDKRGSMRPDARGLSRWRKLPRQFETGRRQRQHASDTPCSTQDGA
jgi:hypothetical protein